MICSSKIELKMILSTFVMSLWGFVAMGQAKTSYNVLHLNSYHHGFTWSDDLSNGIKSAMPTIDGYNVYTEQMDCKRYSNEEAFKWFDPYLKQKFHDKHFDIIIATDNAALDYVVEHKNDSFFKNIPIVFGGITNPQDYPLDEMDLYGVLEFNPFIQSFELIRTVAPKIFDIYIFRDKTTTGILHKLETIEFIKDYPQYKVYSVDSIYLDNIDSIVTSIKPESIIFYFGISIDGRGNLINNDELLKQIIKVSKAPVFSNYVAHIEGSTAGTSITPNDQGIAIAEIAIKRLKGEPIKSRVNSPPPQFIIDFSKMKRYNLEMDSIPSTSMVVNKPENIFVKYKWLIIFNITVIICLIVIIIILTHSYRLQRRSKEMMKVARDNAYESEKLKGAFLANVSHELRTPLNAISGFSEILKMGQSEDECKEYIGIIYNNAQILTKLVNDLLEISMIDANTLRVVKSTIDLNNLFKNLYFQSVSLLKTESKTYIELKTEFNHNYNTIDGDELRISQVMINFINNAIKYTEKGSITIGYKHINEMPELKTQFPTIESAMVFYVTDTGHGIAADKQTFVFGRFNRIDAKYVNQNRGVGLGLNIASSLVDLMGGEVFLYSKIGKGSTFGFYLPM